MLSVAVAAVWCASAAADTVTLFPSADSYLRSGSNANEGTELYMRIQSSAPNRAILRMDQAALQSCRSIFQLHSPNIRQDEIFLATS